MKIHCYKCMRRQVKELFCKCGTCKGREWQKAEHQLFKTSRQRGKETTEEVHQKWRAPEWMIETAMQGGSLRETQWGWELRDPSGQKQNHRGV